MYIYLGLDPCATFPFVLMHVPGILDRVQLQDGRVGLLSNDYEIMELICKLEELLTRWPSNWPEVSAAEIAVFVAEPLQATKLRNILIHRDCRVAVHLLTEQTVPTYKVVLYSHTMTHSGFPKAASPSSSALPNILAALSFATHLFVLLADLPYLTLAEPRVLCLVKLAVNARSLSHPAPHHLLRGLQQLQRHPFVSATLTSQTHGGDADAASVPLTPLSVRSTSSNYWESFSQTKEPLEDAPDSLLRGLTQSQALDTWQPVGDLSDITSSGWNPVTPALSSSGLGTVSDGKQYPVAARQVNQSVLAGLQLRTPIQLDALHHTIHPDEKPSENAPVFESRLTCDTTRDTHTGSLGHFATAGQETLREKLRRIDHLLETDVTDTLRQKLLAKRQLVRNRLGLVERELVLAQEELLLGQDLDTIIDSVRVPFTPAQSAQGPAGVGWGTPVPSTDISHWGTVTAHNAHHYRRQPPGHGHDRSQALYPIESTELLSHCWTGSPGPSRDRLCSASAGRTPYERRLDPAWASTEQVQGHLTNLPSTSSSGWKMQPDSRHPRAPRSWPARQVQSLPQPWGYS
jgi:hypothetical protein